MKKRYFSVDIEASGRTPGKYSMLSIGACIVGDTERKRVFYRELKPISHNFDLEAMRVACLGLKCLDDLEEEEYNPQSENFNPEKVLELLRERGEEPRKVMRDYAEWVRKNTSKDFRAVETAAPVKFDGMFTAWYFDNFYDGENPFGHSGEDINSFYRGVMKNPLVNINGLEIRKEGLTHNALDDAIQQAREFEEVLRIAGIKV